MIEWVEEKREPSHKIFEVTANGNLTVKFEQTLVNHLWNGGKRKSLQRLYQTWTIDYLVEWNLWNLFTHGTPKERSGARSTCVRAFRIELEFGSVGFRGEGNTGVPGGKPLALEQGENQQQTQPTYDAGTGNRTRATLVGGECSHHCATTAPPLYSLFVNHCKAHWAL